MRILCVDDDPRLLASISRQLAHGDHVVEQASDCISALDILACDETGFDLLVTDIETPGRLDGWRLAELARLICPNIDVIYATAAQSMPARAVLGGVMLQKPFTAGTLDSVVTATTAMTRSLH